MSLGTLVVGAIVLACILLAVRSLIKTKKSGGCIGCSECKGCTSEKACNCQHSEVNTSL